MYQTGKSLCECWEEKESCGKEGNSRTAERGRGEGRREGMEMKMDELVKK